MIKGNCQIPLNFKITEAIFKSGITRKKVLIQTIHINSICCAIACFSFEVARPVSANVELLPDPPRLFRDRNATAAFFRIQIIYHNGYIPGGLFPQPRSIRYQITIL